MKRKATKGQRERIMRELLSGLIDFDEAQEIIMKPRAGSADLNILYWENRFPGKGEALMSFRDAFYGWKPELKLALPDLESRARQAVFWRELKGIRLFKGRTSYGLENSLQLSLQRSLNLVGHSLWEVLWDSLGNTLWKSLDEALRDSFKDSYWDEAPDWDRWLHGSFWTPLFYSLGFVIAHRPDEAEKFRPLLELWIAGNFPIGFDKEGDLLIYAAD